MELYDILEAIMIACFGASWPLNVRKSYRARTAKGKSLGFLLLIEVGYIVGIVAKLINPNYIANFSQKWYVLFFYVLNFCMVGADVIVYFRNRRLDAAAEAAAKQE